jgi:hypothetical protein
MSSSSAREPAPPHDPTSPHRHTHTTLDLASPGPPCARLYVAESTQTGYSNTVDSLERRSMKAKVGAERSYDGGVNAPESSLPQAWSLRAE